MKVLSIKEISRGGVSRAVRAAEDEPVLVNRGDEAAIWMVNARDVARVAARFSEDDGAVARSVTALIAVHLFDQGILSLGKAARFAGMALADFIALCDALQVPVLRRPEEGTPAEVDAFEQWLSSVAPPSSAD